MYLSHCCPADGAVFLLRIVTKQLTTVHRTFIDALRTLCVWGVLVALYYITNGQFGEPWDSHSYIQVRCTFVVVTFTFLIVL